jgi:hypothetical protein
VPGQTIAKVHWRALDREGEDNCRLARVGHGWLLIGHARFHDGEGYAALDYVVRCDDEWHTLSADVAGTHGRRELSLTMERQGGAWTLNGQDQPDVQGALDLDLSFTPATNLMPIRRLYGGLEVQCRAAWLTYPGCVLHPLDQTYTTITSDIVAYEGVQTGYAAELSTDSSGFVTRYPGLWEGEVEHAG